MEAPNAVRNAFEARVLGMDVLLWRAQDEARTEILPEGMAAPTACTAADLRKVVEMWLQLGELSAIAKRQSANHTAYGKRDTDRTESTPGWLRWRYRMPR